MARQTNDFQKLITFIEKELSNSNVKVTESAELEEYEGSSKREVDVLIETEVNGHSIKIALECRDHSKPQNKTWVDGLVGKYRDLKVDKIIAVSKSGFTKGAYEKASKVGIRLLSFEQALENNWPEEFRRLSARFFEQKFSLQSATITFKDKRPEIPPEKLWNCIVFTKEGLKEGSFLDVAQMLFKEQSPPLLKKHVDENFVELFSDEKSQTFNLDIPFIAKDRYLEDMTVKLHQIREIILIIKFESLLIPTNNEHYIYNKTQVTISSSGHGSLAIVQFPKTESAKTS